MANIIFLIFRTFLSHHFPSRYSSYLLGSQRSPSTVFSWNSTAPPCWQYRSPPLKEKLQKMKELEEMVRIQQHDLRRQIQSVTELIAKGDKDAVFASYFNQAQKLRIQVDAAISLYRQDLLQQQQSLGVPERGAQSWRSIYLCFLQKKRSRLPV